MFLYRLKIVIMVVRIIIKLTSNNITKDKHENFKDELYKIFRKL